ncbi:MAG: hypothetical protein IJN13_04635 [Bacilli bacterium]|nr:hypothetical protein [Bacilli bacterium]
MAIMSDEKCRQISLEPVNRVIDEIKSKKKSKVFLVGDTACGKSVVLKEYINGYNDPEHALIDATVRYGEFVQIPDSELIRLFQTCLIIKKMLLFIKQNHPQKYMECFVGLESRVDVIYRKVDLIYLVGNYNKKPERIDKVLLEHPEILLEEFLSIATNVLDYKTITLAIDDFDSIGSSSQTYQKYIYNVLSQYVGLLATISDKKVVYSQERQNELSEDNDLVMVDYTKDVEVVKELMDRMNLREMIFSGKMKYRMPISLVIKDETIASMIEKTNGSMFDMAHAVRELYRKMDELTPAEYDQYLLHFIDTEINKNPIFTGFIVPERKLHI